MSIALRQSTASQEVPLGHFLDSTDGNTEEDGLTIANTDIKLWKNGATAFVNKNSGGATNISNGVYYTVLDATDTDTVGPMVIFVHVSGALAVRLECHVYEEAIFDALFGASAAGFDSNGRVDVGSWIGTAVTLSSTTTKPEVDVASVSDDATAANNLELQYDGTGYVDGTAPSTQSQVGNLATGSAAINAVPDTDNTGGAIKGTTFVGTATAGTFASVDAADGSYHNITHSANVIDIVYGYSLTGSDTPVSVTFSGYLDGSNDTLNVHAYDFVGAAWDMIGTITGQAGTTNIQNIYNLLAKHIGTGADLGKIYIRIEGTATAPDLFTDALWVQYAVTSQSAGYANGQIFIDTNASNTNTVPYVDGVAENPVSTIAAANTLNSSVPLNSFHILTGSSITFSATQSSQVFSGEGWTLALGGQDISNSHIFEATISGTGTTGSGSSDIHHCNVGTVTLGEADFLSCGFSATFTAGIAGDYKFINCYSNVSGAGTPTLTWAGVAAATTVGVLGWLGGATWVFTSDCTASIEVLAGGTHTITTGGGNVEFRGAPKAISVTTSGSGTTNLVLWSGCPVTLAGTGGTVNVYGNFGAVSDSTAGATVNLFRGAIGEIGSLATQAKSDVNAEADTALTDYDPPTRAELTTDTNSVLSKLLKYFQLAMRSDAGIATDNATEVTAINADEGSGSGSYSNTSDALEAIRDRGDAAWVTGGGGSITQLLNVQPVLPISIDLANTATVRLGLILINALDDLPSTAEITPGTISIERKAVGGTSWSAVVTDAAMSEQAGMVYFDEVFDSGSGYADGDSIRVTFKSVSITADANTHEVVGTDGIMFQTHIRESMRGTDSALLAASAPTNFSDLAITSGTGQVTVGTNNDKSGYSISGTLTTLDALENISAATVNSQVDTALTDIGLDHLISASVTGTDIVDNSIIARLASKSVTADWDTFDQTTDSLEALRDRGDAAWITGSGASAASIRAEIDANSTQLAAIVADTNELQTDWANDGRLDLLIDGIKAVTDVIPDSGALSTIDTNIDSILSDTGTDGVVLATSEDIYHADIRLTVDGANGQDEYTVTWFKNGVRITSGVTSPTIQVVKRVDGTNLVASTAMTQIGSTGSYKYDEPTNQVTAGEAVVIIVSATIDAGSRSYAKVETRDSSA